MEAIFRRTAIYVVISVVVCISNSVFSEDNHLNLEVIRQQQRLDQLQNKLLNEQFQLGPKKQEIDFVDTNLIVQEESCFSIRHIKFIVNDPLLDLDQAQFNFLFQMLQKKNLIIGQCIGTQSLQNIVKYAQNELIKKVSVNTFNCMR